MSVTITPHYDRFQAFHFYHRTLLSFIIFPRKESCEKRDIETYVVLFNSKILHNSSANRTFDFSRLARCPDFYFYKSVNKSVSVLFRARARSDTLQFSHMPARILMTLAGRLGSRAGERKR